MNNNSLEQEETITFTEFKAWLTGLVRGKGGALPDLEDWKQIKIMIDRVDEPQPEANWNHSFKVDTDDELLSWNQPLTGLYGNTVLTYTQEEQNMAADLGAALQALIDEQKDNG